MKLALAVTAPDVYKSPMGTLVPLCFPFVLCSSFPGRCIIMSALYYTCCTVGLNGSAQDLVSSTHRREVQEYIPAQMYRTMAGSAWLNLIGQHRQQMQALSPHQARAQFLGKSLGWDAQLGRSSPHEGRDWKRRRKPFFPCTKAFLVPAELVTCLERRLFNIFPKASPGLRVILHRKSRK